MIMVNLWPLHRKMGTDSIRGIYNRGLRWPGLSKDRLIKLDFQHLDDQSAKFDDIRIFFFVSSSIDDGIRTSPVPILWTEMVGSGSPSPKA